MISDRKLRIRDFFVENFGLKLNLSERKTRAISRNAAFQWSKISCGPVCIASRLHVVDKSGISRDFRPKFCVAGARSLSTGIWSAPPGPPFNVGGEKRARPALASQTFSSTLIGGQGGRLTKAAQSDQCSRSLDRDAHQISHSVHLFSHFFATIDCNQNQRHLRGESHTNDSHCNSIFARYCLVLKERSHIGDPDPSSN